MLAEGEGEAPVWVTSCSGPDCGETGILWLGSVVETADGTAEASEEASGWTSAVESGVNSGASSEGRAEEPVLGLSSGVSVASSEKNSSGASVLWPVLNGLEDMRWFSVPAGSSTVGSVLSKVGLEDVS